MRGDTKELAKGVNATCKAGGRACQREVEQRTLLESLLGALWALFDRTALPMRLTLYVCLFPLLEVLFVFRVRRFLRLRGAQQPAHHTADTAEVERFWSRVLSEEDATTVDAILRGWFLGEGPICEGNLEELVAWTLYAKPPQALTGARRARVARYLQRLLQRASVISSFPTGHNPRRRCMLHTLEPLEPCWKPLLFYLAVQVVCELGWALLTRRGFERCTHGTLTYWRHLPPPRAAGGAGSGGGVQPPSPPIVVLHGVGGLLPYLPLLLNLRAARPRNPLLAPLMPHCSLTPPAFDPPRPLDSTELVSDLADVVRAHAAHADGANGTNGVASAPAPDGHGIVSGGAPSRSGGGGAAARARALFFGHSLGTAVLASVMKQHPSLVGGAVFVDPICFLLYQRDVVYNFLYASPVPLRHGPKQALHVGYWFRLALHYVLKQEATIQSAFRREFWWGRHWLHPAEVPCEAYVSLSGRDAIVPSHQVHAHLRVHGAAPLISAPSSSVSKAAARAGPPPQAQPPPPPQEEEVAPRPAAAVGSRLGRGRIEVELHERRHHGWGVLEPRARARLVAKLDALMEKMVSKEQATLLHASSSPGHETPPGAASPLLGPTPALGKAGSADEDTTFTDATFSDGTFSDEGSIERAWE